MKRGDASGPDPVTIRRATSDPNPYAYATGSPLRYTDLTGLDSCDSDSTCGATAMQSQDQISQLQDTLTTIQFLTIGSGLLNFINDTVTQSAALPGLQEGTESALSTLNGVSSNLANQIGDLSNQAIGQAVSAYGINTSYTSNLAYNPSIGDSGAATLNRFVTPNQVDVGIGPSAFTSGPGWLGASIGHEAEVHGLQAQQGRYYSPNQDPLGAALDELEGYGYELNNQGRYGLNSSAIESLQASWNVYYQQVLDLGGPAYIPRIAAGNFFLVQ